MKLIRYCSLIASIFLLTSCSYFLDRIPGVYSLDIQQGNMISQDVINQLRPNMSKRQVLFVMGSPMLKDIFHERRWDYLYSLQAGGNPRVQKKISLFFDGDKLIGVQGDYRPSNIAGLKLSNEKTIDLPKRVLDKTLSESILGFFDSSTETKTIKKNTSALEPVITPLPD
jgi:outer membrane protein assembly factor BamE